MKLKTLLLTVSVFAVTIINAQDWTSDTYKYGQQYAGYIIDSKGKKIEGFIKYQNRYTMQNQVMFYGEKDNKKTKQKYSTSDLKEYMVGDKLYHCIHYSGGLMKKPIKANLLVEDGCIAEYRWYDRDDNYLSMRKKSNSKSYE